MLCLQHSLHLPSSPQNVLTALLGSLKVSAVPQPVAVTVHIWKLLPTANESTGLSKCLLTLAKLSILSVPWFVCKWGKYWTMFDRIPGLHKIHVCSRAWFADPRWILSAVCSFCCYCLWLPESKRWSQTLNSDLDRASTYGPPCFFMKYFSIFQ